MLFVSKLLCVFQNHFNSFLWPVERLVVSFTSCVWTNRHNLNIVLGFEYTFGIRDSCEKQGDEKWKLGSKYYKVLTESATS